MNKILSPVVIIADLIADEDHEGWTALTNAAIPVTCGQAMEVPEWMLNCNFPIAGDQADVKSRGCDIKLEAKRSEKNRIMLKSWRRPKQVAIKFSISIKNLLIFNWNCTFKTSGVRALGPFEENVVTRVLDEIPNSLCIKNPRGCFVVHDNKCLEWESR